MATISEIKKRIIMCSGSAKFSKKNSDYENLIYKERMITNKHRLWLNKEITGKQSSKLSIWIETNYAKSMIK